MRNTLALLITVVLAASVSSQTRPANESLVLTHVTVIDMTGAPPKPDMTLVISGDRIKALGPTGEINIPQGAQIVDATGKFLIPGLWDMHVHLNYDKVREVEEAFFPLLIANGVTGVRDMWDVHALAEGMKQITKWRARIASGQLLGPRIGGVPRGIDGPAGGTAYIHVKNEREARKTIQSIKQRGYDFVKVYSFLSRESYFAIADEAKRQGITFAGHVPYALSASEVSDAGQKSIEHLSETIISSSLNEAELRRDQLNLNARIEALKGKPMTPALLEEERLLTTRQIDNYNDEKAAALYARFARNGTYHCPTLVIYRMWASVDDPNLFEDDNLKYVPLRKRKSDKPYLDSMKAWDAKEIAFRKKVYEMRMRQVGAMQRAGVEFLAGTDVAGVYPTAGFSLHDELELFVQAGLTPMQALRTATYNPAKYFNLLGSLGTIEQGKIADVILLEANPLQNIGNTRRITAVITNGRYLSKERLQKLLSEIVTTANKK